MEIQGETMTKKQKAEITKHIKNIDKMDKQKLLLFTQELFIAKSQMDKTIFDWVLKATDVQAKSFSQEVSPMAILSEFRGDDLK